MTPEQPSGFFVHTPIVAVQPPVGSSQKPLSPQNPCTVHPTARTTSDDALSLKVEKALTSSARMPRSEEPLSRSSSHSKASLDEPHLIAEIASFPTLRPRIFAYVTGYPRSTTSQFPL